MVKCTNPSLRNVGNYLFRFQVAWLTNNSFKQFVNEAWNQEVYYMEAANVFTTKVSAWNKDVFGNIFWKKRHLLARLGGIQKALEDYYSHGLLDLEKQLRA